MTVRATRLPEAEKFGAVVRSLRERRALTQEQLAEDAGVSVTYIGLIERGENVPTLTVILQLAKALGVKAAEMLREF